MEESTENPDTNSKRRQYRGEWFDEDWLDGIDEGDWFEKEEDGGKGVWLDDGAEEDRGDWNEAGVEGDWLDGLEAPAENEEKEAIEEQEATAATAGGDDEKEGQEKGTCASYLVGGNWLEDPLGLFDERPAWQTLTSPLEEEDEDEQPTSTLVKMQEGATASVGQ